MFLLHDEQVVYYIYTIYVMCTYVLIIVEFNMHKTTKAKVTKSNCN